MPTVQALAMVGAMVIYTCGCASFRSGEFAEVAPHGPPASEERPSMSVIVRGEATVNGDARAVPSAMLKEWEELSLQAYKASGLFSKVVAGTADTDYQAEVRLVDEGQGNFVLAFVSGLTMTLVPAKAVDRLTVMTTITGKNGAQGSFTKSESVTMWIQLFMIFPMPAHWPGTVVRETIHDLHQATLDEARTRGVL